MKTIKCNGEELSLPEEKNLPLTDLQDASILLYGEKIILNKINNIFTTRFVK